MGLFPMVLAGEASLDQQYAALFDSVVAKCLGGSGGLALENAGGEKCILFSNGGAAP